MKKKRSAQLPLQESKKGKAEEYASPQLIRHGKLKERTAAPMLKLPLGDAMLGMS